MQIKDVGQEARKKLGSVVRKHRIASNISQNDLAKKIGLTRTYLSLLENGKRFPSWETLERISCLLSVKPSKLIMEASLPKYNNEFMLVSLLSKIIESADEKKIKKTLDFAKSLEET